MKRILILVVFFATTDLIGPAALLAQQFAPPVYYTVGTPYSTPYQVVSADFNHDGNPDLAVVDYQTSQANILLGNGDGTFKRRKTFYAPAPVGMAVGDFNEDGKPDLAIVEYGGTGHSRLGLFMGQGDGTFRKGAFYTVGIESYSVAVADFNGDGHADIAVSSLYGNGNVGGVMVFFGKGNGKLGTPQEYKVGGMSSSVSAADLNGDGHPDLAVTEVEGQCVAILLNNGKGKFGKPVTYPTVGPSGAVAVAIGDLNGDGIPDLAVAANDVDAGLDIFLGEGNGVFGPAAYYGENDTYAVAIADFNLDGHPDVVTIDPYDGVSLYYGNGDGTFQGVGILGNRNTGMAVAVGDFDKNGSPDVVFTTQNKPAKVAVLLNTQHSQ